ncbi:MAG: DNA adenine methylase [Planctomycetes bacterium]|nr:DNA adenine methylase [Planctomycetota bacterium]
MPPLLSSNGAAAVATRRLPPVPRRNAPATVAVLPARPGALARCKLTPPLKWHGGKNYLAKRIIELMPPHVHYVEPFAGGLAVLLAKDPEGVSEVVNDVDGNLMNFWRTLQVPDTFERFARVVQAIPFSEVEWREAMPSNLGSSLRQAIAFFVRCRQSLAGRQSCFAPLSRTRTRKGMNEQAAAWLGAVDGLAAVHARLRRVVILNRPAVEVIRQQDGPDTLIYCDPPYLASKRTAPDVYAHEMTTADHRELVTCLCHCKGKVMLSGYRSVLYDAALSGWTRHDFDVANNAASGKEKRRMTECVWCNW